MHHDTPEAHYPPNSPGGFPPFCYFVVTPPFVVPPWGAEGLPRTVPMYRPLPGPWSSPPLPPGGSNF